MFAFMIIVTSTDDFFNLLCSKVRFNDKEVFITLRLMSCVTRAYFKYADHTFPEQYAVWIDDSKFQSCV